jgi:hypothetical protein
MPIQQVGDAEVHLRRLPEPIVRRRTGKGRAAEPNLLENAGMVENDRLGQSVKSKRIATVRLLASMQQKPFSTFCVLQIQHRSPSGLSFGHPYLESDCDLLM